MENLDVITNPLLHIVLDRPRIAGNVAAIVRLSVACKCALHVCGPLLFAQNDKTKWRAGLDYFYGARVHFHYDIFRCLKLLNKEPWIVEVGGKKTPWQAQFKLGDVMVLGPETDSVRDEVIKQYPERILTLPQIGPVRSLNLAQCASVVTFEAIRQGMNYSF